MISQSIRCGACTLPLPAGSWLERHPVSCPTCGARTEATIFPAIAGTPGGALPEPIDTEGEAACFYHPGYRAVTPCEDCGRFMCNLCELSADGKHICPACFAAGLKSKDLLEFETRRTNYDSIALALNLPALLIWPALFSAPAALFMVFRHWNSPRGLLRRSRFRYYLAAFLALSEIGSLLVIIALIIRQIPFFRS